MAPALAWVSQETRHQQTGGAGDPWALGLYWVGSRGGCDTHSCDHGSLWDGEPGHYPTLLGSLSLPMAGGSSACALMSGGPQPGEREQLCALELCHGTPWLPVCARSQVSADNPGGPSGAPQHLTIPGASGTSLCWDAPRACHRPRLRSTLPVPAPEPSCGCGVVVRALELEAFLCPESLWENWECTVSWPALAWGCCVLVPHAGAKPAASMIVLLHGQWQMQLPSHVGIAWLWAPAPHHKAGPASSTRHSTGRARNSGT